MTAENPDNGRGSDDGEGGFNEAAADDRGKPPLVARPDAAAELQ